MYNFSQRAMRRQAKWRRVRGWLWLAFAVIVSWVALAGLIYGLCGSPDVRSEAHSGAYLQVTETEDGR